MIPLWVPMLSVIAAIGILVFILWIAGLYCDRKFAREDIERYQKEIVDLKKELEEKKKELREIHEWMDNRPDSLGY